MIRNGMKPIHPDEFPRETLDELGISQARFARSVGLAPMRISHVIKGARPVSAELALLIGRALGQSPEYWINLQSTFDLKMAERTMKARSRDIVEVAAID